MYLVDSNIFLELMLAQARSGECRALLNALRKGDVEAFISDFTVYSIMIIMADLSKMDELRIFLSSLSAYKGITVYRNRLTDMLRAVEIDQKEGLDIEHSIQYASALALGVKAIVSFDNHFDELEIPRVEPAQLI